MHSTGRVKTKKSEKSNKQILRKKTKGLLWDQFLTGQIRIFDKHQDNVHSFIVFTKNVNIFHNASMSKSLKNL